MKITNEYKDTSSAPTDTDHSCRTNNDPGRVVGDEATAVVVRRTENAPGVTGKRHCIGGDEPVAAAPDLEEDRNIPLEKSDKETRCHNRNSRHCSLTLRGPSLTWDDRGKSKIIGERKHEVDMNTH